MVDTISIGLTPNSLADYLTQDPGELIVEAERDSKSRWTFVRVRTDKSHPNHFTTLQDIIESMRDPVDEARVS